MFHQWLQHGSAHFGDVDAVVGFEQSEWSPVRYLFLPETQRLCMGCFLGNLFLSCEWKDGKPVEGGTEKKSGTAVPCMVQEAGFEVWLQGYFGMAGAQQ